MKVKGCTKTRGDKNADEDEKRCGSSVFIYTFEVAPFLLSNSREMESVSARLTR